MPIMQGTAWTFDTVAAMYTAMRPSYPKELYQAIFNYISLDKSCHAVEIGIGGGQATLPILKTGCKLTAVESGKHFSRLCKKKFKAYQTFSVITDTFENAPFATARYDFVYSASAFHWIPEQVGYTKVFTMLKSGGAFARFATHPYRAKGNPSLSKEIDDVYAAYYYKHYDMPQEAPIEYREEQAAQRAVLAEKYGFVAVEYALFHRTRTLSASEYTALIGTYSDHIAIEESVRTAFFSKIEAAINHHGGSIAIYDTIDLQLARKP